MEATEAMIEFAKKVSEIQRTLNAPKGQFNAFGKYKYRNAEDILEAVKPLLDGLVLTISDDIAPIGERYYIKATTTITDGINKIANTAFAREPLTRKGMDEAQVTGASSSYARKYALNGLFCIDDNKDPDTNEKKHETTNEYTEKATKIGEIKKLAGAKVRGKTSEETKDFMNRVVGIEKYSDLNSKTLGSLLIIIDEIKASE